MAAAVVFLPRRYLSEAWGDVACVVVLGTAYALLTAFLFARLDLIERDAIRNAVTRIVTVASRRRKG
jgi:putative effector of murein hydrolase